MCGTSGTSCSGLPVLLPCAPARLRAWFPRCKTRLEFLTAAVPGHKVQLHSLLPPAHAEDGIPLGVLLPVFVFPSCVDLFLFNQVRSVHRSDPPSAENFHLKQISDSLGFLDQPSLLTPRVAWFDFICRPSYKCKPLSHGCLHIKMHFSRSMHQVCLFPCSFHLLCQGQTSSFEELLKFLPININF